MGPVGVVYILTNPSFPDHVKIGYATDMEERLKQLNRSECVPFAFRVHATYAVLRPMQDRELHALIDRLNPDLRAIETFDGRTRVKEFYAMSAEDAYALLESIARLSGTEDRLVLWAGTRAARQDDETALDVGMAARERRRPFRFSAYGIASGEEIYLTDMPEVTASVLDDTRILCEDETGELQTGTMAAFARMYLGLERLPVGFRYWSYKGRSLSDIRAGLAASVTA